MPLCPSHVPLASPSCPAPQLVKVPGQCCLSINCHRGTTVVPPAHRRPESPPYPPYPFIPYPAYPYPKPYPKLYRKLYPYKPKKEKDALGNELMEVGRKWDKLRGNKHLAGKTGCRRVASQCRLFPVQHHVCALAILAPDAQTASLCTPPSASVCVSIYVRLVFHWLLAHQRFSASHTAHTSVTQLSLSVITLSMRQCCLVSE